MAALIRPFTVDDIPFALEQTGREGWDTAVELFEACLAIDPDGCFIAELDGRSTGMVTSTRYFRSGWIGNLIVTPECRSRGIGRALMERAIARLNGEGVGTIRLEADPAGVPLYRSLGFADEDESPRYFRPAAPCGGRRSAEPIDASHMSRVAEFDAPYFGDDRQRLLRMLHKQARGTAWVRDGAEVLGYALAGPSLFGARIGPCVAVNADIAERLIESLVAGLASENLILAVPEMNAAVSPLLVGLGFQRRPSCLRMLLGEGASVGRPEHIYAIANGAMG